MGKHTSTSTRKVRPVYRYQNWHHKHCWPLSGQLYIDKRKKVHNRGPQLQEYEISYERYIKFEEMVVQQRVDKVP